MKRKANTTIALLAVLTAMGCENMGLDYASPDEDRQWPPSALVASVIQPAAAVEGPELVVDGRLWVASGLPVALDEQDLRPVGSARGTTLHARTWDTPPYDALFAPEDDGEHWLAFQPVLGGDAPAGMTEHGRTDDGAAEAARGGGLDPTVREDAAQEDAAQEDTGEH